MYDIKIQIVRRAIKIKMNPFWQSCSTHFFIILRIIFQYYIFKISHPREIFLIITITFRNNKLILQVLREHYYYFFFKCHFKISIFLIITATLDFHFFFFLKQFPLTNELPCISLSTYFGSLSKFLAVYFIKKTNVDFNTCHKNSSILKVLSFTSSLINFFFF